MAFFYEETSLLGNLKLRRLLVLRFGMMYPALRTYYAINVLPRKLDTLKGVRAVLIKKPQ